MYTRHTALIIRMALTLCAFLFSTVSLAEGALQLAPLRLVFSSVSIANASNHSANTATLTVKNRGDTASLVQLEILSWSQKENEEVLEPTRDILISPPVFTIAAKSEQTLRAVLRRKPDANNQLSYRLFVREVQDQSQPVEPGAIKVLLNISIPVFVEPINKPTANLQSQLKWSAKRVQANKLHIKLNNAGTQHIQIKSFQISSHDKTIGQNAMRYALAGSSVEWVIEAKDLPLNTPLLLQAVTDNGDLRETIALEQP